VDDEDFRQKANTLEESSRTYASALEFAETDDARAELQAAQALVAESLARLYASTTPEAGASPPAIPFLRRAAAHWSEIRRAEPTLDDATMGLARCLLAIAAYADPTGPTCSERSGLTVIRLHDGHRAGFLILCGSTCWVVVIPLPPPSCRSPNWYRLKYLLPWDGGGTQQ